FDGLFTHPQLEGDLLVEHARRDEVADFPFPFRETREPFLGIALPIVLLALSHRLESRPIDGRQQLLFVNRLLEKINRALPHRSRRGRDIALRAEEDDGHRDALATHLTLYVEAAQTWHPQIEQQAPDAVVERAFEKRRWRRERLYRDVVGA